MTQNEIIAYQAKMLVEAQRELNKLKSENRDLKKQLEFTTGLVDYIMQRNGISRVSFPVDKIAIESDFEIAENLSGECILIRKGVRK